jgi:threonine dehydrogenase-like Zn-dependent dehydrogenase
MRGAVLYAPGHVRVEERDDPKIIEPTDAIIRLSATCVCGSDLWPYRGVEAVDGPSPMGHEYAGVVREVENEVKHITPGQFVVGSFFASDNTCELCQAGYQTACINRQPIGAEGAQAEYLRVPLADGTLVATPDLPSDDLIPACWPPRTCSAPAGPGPWPPRPAPTRRSRSSVTAPSGCWPCWPPASSGPSGSSP